MVPWLSFVERWPRAGSQVMLGRYPTRHCSGRAPLRFCAPSCTILLSRFAPLSAEPLAAQNVMQRQAIFEVILGLVENNDWDIFDEVADQHPSEFSPSDR